MGNLLRTDLSLFYAHFDKWGPWCFLAAPVFTQKAPSDLSSVWEGTAFNFIDVNQAFCIISSKETESFSFLLSPL